MWEKSICIVFVLTLNCACIFSHPLITAEKCEEFSSETIRQSESDGETIKLSLLPVNMIKYVGKVNRDEFENVVGSPAGYEDDFVVYNVINEYDEIETGIRCYYRKSDSKLISVKFGTPHYLGYWIDFTRLKGYPEKEAIAKSKGNYVSKEDRFGRLYRINLRLGTFGCQIMDIFDNYNYSTAVINYHIVK